MQLQAKKKSGRPRKWGRERIVRYALTEEGDAVTVSTVGLSWLMMVDVTEWFRPASREQRLVREDLYYKRNGHISSMLTLTLVGWDRRFCGMEDIPILFEARVKAICKAQDIGLDLKKVGYERLLNL